ncbi:MAG: hypothetical protein N3A38_07990 [Planctomycetota bacterium]|nr:hypothetical protein [Planctomycetota bacterium]
MPVKRKRGAAHGGRRCAARDGGEYGPVAAGSRRAEEAPAQRLRGAGRADDSGAPA